MKKIEELRNKFIVDTVPKGYETNVPPRVSKKISIFAEDLRPLLFWASIGVSMSSGGNHENKIIQIINKNADRIRYQLHVEPKWKGLAPAATDEEKGAVSTIRRQDVEGSGPWPPRRRTKMSDLRSALQRLYEETADYIRINNLGDVHHNQAMKDAKAALALPEAQCHAQCSRCLVWHSAGTLQQAQVQAEQCDHANPEP